VTLQEIRKTIKVTFKDESKKKVPKDPFNLEGLQKVLKIMSNEMVDIKKQVVESSKTPLVLLNKSVVPFTTTFHYIK